MPSSGSRVSRSCSIDLGPRAIAELVGKLTWDAYHDLLADTDVGLALMASPHPGHLSLELPMAGIPTVTNAFGTIRESWIDGLLVVGDDPESVAAGLAAATKIASGLTDHEPKEIRLDLGARCPMPSRGSPRRCRTTRRRPRDSRSTEFTQT